MTQEITKELMCIRLRSGIEIWADANRIEPLKKVLLSGGSALFFDYEGETINTGEIAGIFRASTMEEMTRRKNGQWKCKGNIWHEGIHRRWLERRYARAAATGPASSRC